jgi:hypothetical protein
MMSNHAKLVDSELADAQAVIEEARAQGATEQQSIEEYACFDCAHSD